MKYQLTATGHTVNVTHFLEEILERQQSPLNLGYKEFNLENVTWKTKMIDFDTFESVAKVDFSVAEKAIRKSDLDIIRQLSGVKLKLVKVEAND